MTRPHPPTRPHVDPPFSPALLAGLAAAPLPVFMLQPAVTMAMRVFLKRYPGIADRMAPYPDAVVGIDPVDLPFSLVLSFGTGGPELRMVRDLDRAGCTITAAVHGPLSVLTALAEGRIDGDAVFFSRRLVIEGDTEVILALRNAIDDADVNLARDLVKLLGPVQRPLAPLHRVLNRIMGGVAGEMDRLRQALTGPLERDLERQAVRIGALETDLRRLHATRLKKEPR